MISKILQILGLQPRVFKSFSGSLEQFFLTIGQSNFGNRIPSIVSCWVFFSEAKVGSMLKGDFKQRNICFVEKRHIIMLDSP